MFELQSCCYCIPVRKACLIFGLFTLAFYTLLLTSGSFMLNTISQSTTVMVLNAMMIVCSGTCVVASIFMIIGICVESSPMLLPWIICIPVTTVIDTIFSFFLANDIEKMSNREYANISLELILIIDSILITINFYGIFCVISQYFFYADKDNGRHGDDFPGDLKLSGLNVKGDKLRVKDMPEIRVTKKRMSQRVHLELPGGTNSEPSAASDSIEEMGSYKTTMTFLDNSVEMAKNDPKLREGHGYGADHDEFKTPVVLVLYEEDGSDMDRGTTV